MLEDHKENERIIADFPTEWWNNLDPDMRRKVSVMMFTMAELLEK